jgi:hypothetical protein
MPFNSKDVLLGNFGIFKISFTEKKLGMGTLCAHFELLPGVKTFFFTLSSNQSR